MPPDNLKPGLEPKPEAGTSFISLDAIDQLGPNALKTFGIEGILAVSLRLLASAWDNESCDRIIRQASDIFRSHTGKTNLAEIKPRGTHLVQATLEFTLAGSPGPHTVQIFPPAEVKCARPADATLVHAWLAKSPLRVAKKLPRTLLLTALALATATAFAFDDNDGDDEDFDAERFHIHHACGARPRRKNLQNTTFEAPPSVPCLPVAAQVSRRTQLPTSRPFIPPPLCRHLCRHLCRSDQTPHHAIRSNPHDH